MGRAQHGRLKCQNAQCERQREVEYVARKPGRVPHRVGRKDAVEGLQSGVASQGTSCRAQSLADKGPGGAIGRVGRTFGLKARGNFGKADASTC